MDNDITNEKPSFIVQNVTLGYHFVSDINLQFSPKEVKDLTWEEEAFIKRSKDLKDSLRTGILKKLSQEEYDKTMEMQYQKERKQLLREQKNKDKYEKVKINDKDFEADTFDVAKSKRKSSELDLTGTANHPMSYVAAYEIASNLAAERGDELTAEEFSEIVEQNPNIVPQLLSQTKTAQNSKEHKVFYAVPQGEFSNSVGVVEGKMINYNKEFRGASSDSIMEKSAYIQDALDLSGYSGDDSSDSDYASESDLNFAEEIVIEDE